MERDGRVWKEMGEKYPHFCFRNGGGRETGKIYSTYPGTLALGGSCLCRSAVLSNTLPNGFQI